MMPQTKKDELIIQSEILGKKSTRKKMTEKPQKSIYPKNTRRSKRVDSETESPVLPKDIPKTQSDSLIIFENFSGDVTKIIIQVPITLLYQNSFACVARTRIEKKVINIKFNKDFGDILICECQLVQISQENRDQEQLTIYFWGKYLWMTSTQISNKVIKKTRRQIASSISNEFFKIYLKDINSDLLILLNLKPQEQLTDDYNGLINQGNTCYMNSYLQMLYHISQFRNLVFSADVQDPKKFPAPLQNLFYRLQNGDKSASPQQLVRSFGWTKKQVQVQQDAQQFSCLFFEVLEKKLNQSCKNTTHLSLNQLFQGYVNMLVMYYFNADYRTQNTERFFDLQLGISNNLSQSLDQYVEEHVLDGDNMYHTENHGLQQAHKGAKFSILPPILIFQIKRFRYNPYSESNQKILKRFEYPEMINFSKWCLSAKNDNYELYGVLVHEGSKAQSGHYYVYLKCDDIWYKFNDQSVQIVTKQKAINDNFGGDVQTIDLDTRQMKVTQHIVQSKVTAYMLVYMNVNLKQKLLTVSQKYPEWLLKENQNRLNLQKQKKNKKFYIYDIPYISWQQNIQYKQWNNFGFIQNYINQKQLQTFKIISKIQKVNIWLNQNTKSQKGVYTYSLSLERQVLVNINQKPNSTMKEFFKDMNQPLLIMNSIIAPKNSYLLIIKEFRINLKSSGQKKFISCRSVRKDLSHTQFIEILKINYQLEDHSCRYYIEDKKIGAAQVLESQNLIPMIQPTRNQLMIAIIEYKPNNLEEEDYRILCFEKWCEWTINSVQIIIRNEQDPNISDQIELDKNKSIQELRQIIFNKIIDGDKKYLSANHIILKNKIKKYGKIFIEIDKDITIRQAIKYDNMIVFTHSMLDFNQRINQFHLCFSYRFKDGNLSQQFTTLMNRNIEEQDMISNIIEHEEMIKYAHKQGFNTVRILLLSKDLKYIKHTINYLYQAIPKIDLKNALIRDKNCYLLVQGEQTKINQFNSNSNNKNRNKKNNMNIVNNNGDDRNKQQKDKANNLIEIQNETVIIFSHQIARAGQKIGIPQCLKVPINMTLCQLRIIFLDQICDQRNYWQGKYMSVNPYKIVIIIYQKDINRGILLQESQMVCDHKSIASQQILDDEDNQNNQKKTIYTQFGKIKFMRLLINHHYLNRGIQPLKLNVQ